MELKYNTKIQKQGGTLATSIPKIIQDMLKLKKGETVTWNIKLNTQQITITKKE